MSDKLQFFRERLGSLKREGESIAAFARRAEVSPQLMRTWLSGENKSPRPETAAALASRLGVSAAWLLYGTDEDALNNNTVRRVAQHTSKSLTDDDLITVAAGYILDLKTVPRPERQALADCLRRALADEGFRAKMLEYQRFLELSTKGKKK